MDATSPLSGVAGAVLDAGSRGWDDARLSHAGLSRPDTIVRVASVDDVSTAVRFAAGLRRPVVVRSGGHSAWCTLDGGVLIDLSALDQVDVSPDAEADGRRRVRIGGGAKWGDVARALAPHALGISSGDTASVGVGGLTLGGGIGWMVRAWGLAADQLVGAQLVTAEGAVVEASPQSHPELFWGLRGGGGNFGVVTRFDFLAHPLPAVAFAELAVDGDPASVLRVLDDVMRVAPRELTVTYLDVPAMDPSAPAGRSLTACWAGDDAAALRGALAPVLAVDGVTLTSIDARPYVDILLESPGADPAAPLPGFIGGNALVDTLDAVLDDLLAFRSSTDASVLLLRSLGGAYGDVADGDTPFPARRATWFAMAGAFDVPGLVDDTARARLRAAWDGIEARGSGVYGNFVADADPGYVSRMFTPEVRARLGALKRAWDPTNLFSRNHNITPD